MDFNYKIILVDYATKPLMIVKYATDISSNIIKLNLFVISVRKIKHFRLTRTAAITVLASAVNVHKFRVGTCL